MKAIIDDKIPYIRGPIQALVEEAVFMRGSEIGNDDVRDADILIVVEDHGDVFLGVGNADVGDAVDGDGVCDLGHLRRDYDVDVSTCNRFPNAFD